MRSQWIRAGLTERDLETDTRRESSREDGGRGLEGRVYKPGALGSHQPPDGPPDAGRGRKDPPPEPSEGARLGQRPGFRLQPPGCERMRLLFQATVLVTGLWDGSLGPPVQDPSPGGHVPT